MKNLNLFITAVTAAAPSSNFKGQNEGNAGILQKISFDNTIRTIISAESLRSALRERLEAANMPMNRFRIFTETAPTVGYKSKPNPKEYIDDFWFGWMTTEEAKEDDSVIAENDQIKSEVVDGVEIEDDSTLIKNDKKKNSKKTAKKGTLKKGSSDKRESLIRNNIGVSTREFNYESLFHQSPGVSEGPQKNKSAGIFTNEIHYTAYQYPIALNISGAYDDAKEIGEVDKFFIWLEALLVAIVDLGGASGNQSRSLYDFSPQKMVVRLTGNLSPGFPMYCFDEREEITEEALNKINKIDTSEILYFQDVDLNIVKILMEKIKLALEV